MRAGSQNPADKVPMISQLYLNKSPTLMMTYSENEGQNLIVLRLWRSNYHLHHYLQPLWLGSVVSIHLIKTQPHLPHPIADEDYIIKALPNFRINQIKLPKRCLQSLPYKATQTLLIIKEPETK